MFIFVGICVSCSHSKYQAQILSEVEKIAYRYPDSALALLESIEPSDLKADSLKAKYYFIKAYGHMMCNRSMTVDSLIPFAHNYYRGKDVVNDMRSGATLAWYKFWIGDTPGAIVTLDSLVALSAVPDSLITEILRTRVLLGVAEYQGREIIPLAKRLYKLETEPEKKMEAKHMLLAAYLYAGETDSALCLNNELINYARNHNQRLKQFVFTIERAQYLTEIGQIDESDKLIDEIFSNVGPENEAADQLNFQYAINALSVGNINLAARHLAVADSLASQMRGDDDAYFRNYSNLLHAIIDFKRTGRIKLMQIAGLNNRMNERFNRMKTSQWESERDALYQQNRALALKAESRQKTVIILVISVVAILIFGICAWIFRIRRQRARDNEERIEALQKMVDEYKSPLPGEPMTADSPSIRRIMLKQLGVIKMVAETPTEQNREMLRRISAIEGETNGELVDWEKIFVIIDNLYSGFYSKLHEKYGKFLNTKEEQIIVLLLAGFSTKEISVITGQTTSTIYVRKSSIRKKLGVPEKEDIVKHLEDLYKD